MLGDHLGTGAHLLLVSTQISSWWINRGTYTANGVGVRILDLPFEAVGFDIHVGIFRVPKIVIPNEH